MITHTRLFLLVSTLFFSVFGGGLSAQQVNRSPVVLPAVPSEEVSIQLLSLRDERVKSDYEVALVMAGETEFQGLTVANAAVVTFFGPVLEDGEKKRELSKQLFLWNEKYGWFLCEFGERLGRTTVFIWSELKGEIEID